MCAGRARFFRALARRCQRDGLPLPAVALVCNGGGAGLRASMEWSAAQGSPWKSHTRAPEKYDSELVFRSKVGAKGTLQLHNSTRTLSLLSAFCPFEGAAYGKSHWPFGTHASLPPPPHTHARCCRAAQAAFGAGVCHRE